HPVVGDSGDIGSWPGGDGFGGEDGVEGVGCGGCVAAVCGGRSLLIRRVIYSHVEEGDTELIYATSVVNAAYAQLVLLVYKVTAVFNKVNAAKSRVTTTVRVSTIGRIKWLEDQDMKVNEI
nr:hypothetical protein [Tanacetum cinerariifolium]